ncbi:response regulator transcription factor [Cohnella fermenti]|uniref:Response regulator n=1 Tax=Cohnella fermenti TaxID=2565925 RepID=A0A4S4BGI3_9BACL|nr:response regulator [Cohnella fermenti]THF73442.1 response regulator [Cohnella fermenti]
MYKILVVDDEPRVSAGIRGHLLQSGLPIAHVEAASNGFEALDCLRMDAYDLVLTDIQMAMMNGIELMEAILLEQPHLPVIVISAYEKFAFAKTALRLGAKDYLIKPVELDELIRVVDKALREKKEAGQRTMRQSSPADDDPRRRRQEALMELVTERNLRERDYRELLREIGGSLKADCSYGVAVVNLVLSRGGLHNEMIPRKDRKLLKYAAVNILEESLSDWCGVAFEGFGSRLVCVIQLEASEAGDSGRQANSRVSLIGQTIVMNLKQYLNVETTVGMSTLCTDLALLPRLMEEAEAALEWSRLHPDNPFHYYADMAALESVRMMEWAGKVDSLALLLRSEEEELAAESMRDACRSLGLLLRSEGLFHSCFGILVYRLYGLLFDYGPGGGETMRHLDPEFYFRGLAPDAKLERLESYMAELAGLLQTRQDEQNRTVVSQIIAYIDLHYGNCELKIQDIAGEVHFSAAYISYLFKKETNQNIWDYVSRIRIEEAKRLLAATDLKRYEVSYKVGYQSPEHFSRMFKRLTGISPADYRKDVRGNQPEASL